MKAGILFGGPSREREIAFAGGRTVYDNLNKSIFEAVPIFIDSNRNFILLDWQYIYKGTIRDFYPPVDHLPASPNAFQIYIESLGNISNSRQNEIIEKVARNRRARGDPGERCPSPRRRCWAVRPAARRANRTTSPCRDPTPASEGAHRDARRLAHSRSDGS